MAIRNFYVDGRIDGRNTPVTGGPENKTGGMYVDIHIRDQGQSRLGIRVNCIEKDGKLILAVEDGDGNAIHRIETKR
jgi:hypothetical protein